MNLRRRALVEQRVHEEINVALAVAKFDIGEAVVLLRQSKHGLGEEGNGLDVHRQLACASAEEIAGHSDVIAEVEEFVQLEGLITHGVLAYVNLQTRAVLLELRESCLALGTDGHDPASYGDADALHFELFGCCAVVCFPKLGNEVRRRIGVGISGLAKSLDLLELFLAESEEVSLEV